MRTYLIRITERQRRITSAYLRHLLLTSVRGDLPEHAELERLTERFEGLPYLENGDTIHDITRRPREPQ